MTPTDETPADEPVPTKSEFRAAYSSKAPWDIGRTQKAFLQVADQIIGTVLDCGCGTGETALFLASRGHEVTGFDFLDGPIEVARQKADERNLTVDFRQADALDLNTWDERFQTVVDCGLFHVFNDLDRARYVQGLREVLEPDGHLWILCFSQREPGTVGPRRIGESEFRSSFVDGWSVQSIEPTFFEVRPDLPDFQFSGGRAHAWIAHVVKLA